MSDWIPGFDRSILGNSSGSWAPDNEDAPKIVLHTTEGPTVGAATSAFHANNSWPHFTVDPIRRRRFQHVPLSQAARALRNTSAPGQTNREARVYQIEIVATSHDPDRAPAGQISVSSFTQEDLEWLGLFVVGPLAAATGTPLTTSVTFYGERAGFTLATANAPQRLSPAEWDTYTGVLGHQHVPENTHWDPGPLDVASILAAAGGAKPQPKGPLMALSDAEQTQLLRDVAEIRRQVASSQDTNARGGATLRWLVNNNRGRVARLLERIRG